jgi:hypothetical protein
MSLDASGKKKADDRGHGRRPSPVPPTEGLDAGARSGRVVGADGVDEARRVFLHTVHRGIVRSRRSIGNSAMLVQDDAGRIRTNAGTGNNELSRIIGRSGVGLRLGRSDIPHRQFRRSDVTVTRFLLALVEQFGRLVRVGRAECSPDRSCSRRPLDLFGRGLSLSTAAWSPRALILSCENVLMLNLPWIDPSYATTLVSENGSTNVTSPRSAVNG